jgi:hypothetical protein
VPGPILATHLAATLLGGGSDVDASSALAGAAEGTTVVGAVRRPSPGTGTTGGADGLAPVLVAHLSSLDVVVMVGDDGISAVEAGGLEAVAVHRSLDPLTPLWRVAALPTGRPVAGPDTARRWRQAQRVVGGAQLVGLAAANLEMAVAYAKQREQFGKPIGSFQAVKHLCADMLVAAETARAAVHAAAVTIDQPGVGDPDRAAAGAGLLAAEAAIKNGKTSIQVHGGMGFTWEVPAHLYLMRARVVAEAIGPVDGFAEELAEIY